MNNAKIVITWLLLVPVVVYNIRQAFATYRVDAKLWKVLIHAAVVTGLGVLIVDLGVFSLAMQYDLSLAPTHKSQFASPKLTVNGAKSSPKPARAASAKPKTSRKKA